MHELAARAGAVDLNLLLVDGRPVSFCYNYHWHGHLFGLRSGYDANSAAWAAGAVLMGLQIEDGFQRGDTTLDLGTGYRDNKVPWMTKLERSYRYTYYARAVPKAQVLRLKHWWQARRGKNEDGSSKFEGRSSGNPLMAP